MADQQQTNSTTPKTGRQLSMAEVVANANATSNPNTTAKAKAKANLQTNNSNTAPSSLNPLDVAWNPINYGGRPVRCWFRNRVIEQNHLDPVLVNQAQLAPDQGAWLQRQEYNEERNARTEEDEERDSEFHGERSLQPLQPRGKDRGESRRDSRAPPH